MVGAGLGGLDLGSADIGYVIDWLNCARSHGLRISYLGGWNERGFRHRLVRAAAADAERRRLRYVRLMAADTFSDRTVAHGRRVYDPAQTWYVARVAAAHPAFRAALGVLAAHDTCGGPDPGLSVRVDPGGPAAGPAAVGERAGRDARPHRAGRPGPVGQRRVHPGGHHRVRAVADDHGHAAGPAVRRPRLVDASEPQAGHYAVSPITWAIAQTTQFTEPGWRHVDAASGYLGNSGTYAAYESPDHRDWSLVTENAGRHADQRAGPQRITVHLAGGLRDGTVRVWSTNLDSSRPSTWFVHRPSLHPSRGTFSYTIQPDYAVTFTSTSGQSRLSGQAPAAAPMRLPYRARPDASNEPWGLAAQEGAFVYQPCQGGQAGQCIQQQTTSKPVFWSPAMTADPPSPYALTGAPGWAGYTVSARVLLPTATASAGLIGRFSHQGGDPVQFDGYQFDLHGDGSWRLAAQPLRRPGAGARLGPRGGHPAGHLARHRAAAERPAHHRQRRRARRRSGDQLGVPVRAGGHRVELRRGPVHRPRCALAVADAALTELFARAGCRGWLCVREIDGDGEVACGADELVVTASVFKVAVALEVFRQASAGRLDLRERLLVGPQRPHAGADRPVGLRRQGRAVRPRPGDHDADGQRQRRHRRADRPGGPGPPARHPG